MIIDEEEYYLSHVGTPRHSGRYPWGSGDNETNTRNPTTLDEINALKNNGVSEENIVKGNGYKSSGQLRSETTIANNSAKQDKINQLTRLVYDKQMSVNAAAKQMGMAESTARSWLKPAAKDKADSLATTVNMLRDDVDKYRFVDVGKGNASKIGISQEKLNTAIEVLKKEGYEVHAYKNEQVATGKDTRYKVLGPPGSKQREIFDNPTLIKTASFYSEDYGRGYNKRQDPLSFDPKRLQVVYGDEGGGKADGVMYVRPGVKDVELGGKTYAQVRVKVGKDHFIKGMALYNDNLPDGVDIQFHTAKRDTGNKLDALKPLEKDPDLPFGSIVRQIPDVIGNPGSKPTSVMNIVNDDDDWREWSRTLSQQFLSKQDPVKLAKPQLDMTYERRVNDLNSIKKLSNPTVREKLLLDFAGSTDTAVVHLKAAAMPGQAVKVLLPVTNIKPTEVYAPGFKNGERVVLIRHPHGGTFEIPELTVNNNNAEGRRLIGNKAEVAIGIHHEVAKRLSGADFDGDTVLVIPNRSRMITHTPALEALKDFDPIRSYPGYPGMKVLANTQTAMGNISNLITDMTIKGAPHDEIARAVKHSMVVIDAEKKELDYRKSATDNNIKQLKQKYQRQPDGSTGAATLLSRRKYGERIPEREPRRASRGGPIDPVTGAVVYEPTNKTWGKNGPPKSSRVPRIQLTDDAHTLSSGTQIEALYATHANKLKALANEARLEALKTPPLKRNPSSAKAYKSEVDSLTAKLNVAKSNAPLERQAQLIANSKIRLKRNENPNMDEKTLKKVKYQALKDSRNLTGADKKKIDITDKEWDAIQAGAISDSKLTEILTHADMDKVYALARPKEQVLMTPAATANAMALLARGYTRAEVAEHLGVSVSTLDKGTVG